MSLFGGPGTPARPMSRLHLAVICGNVAGVRRLLDKGDDPNERVDPNLHNLIDRVPSFGFNEPLVARIYMFIDYDMRLIEPGMTARELALAGGRDDVLREIEKYAAA